MRTVQFSAFSERGICVELTGFSMVKPLNKDGVPEFIKGQTSVGHPRSACPLRSSCKTYCLQDLSQETSSNVLQT